MSNKNWFFRGMRDGVPIGMGYFAVAFTLGIAAKKVGFTAIQSALMSLTMHASAGEFAVLTVVASGAGYLEMAVTELIVNLRYILMSCALSQRIDHTIRPVHRFILSNFVTDEIFGLSVGVKGSVNPYYLYGAASVASPGWVVGTFLGVVLGTVLPANVANAMNIALYGMFLAVIIPPAKKDRVIAAVVLVSMLASLLFSLAPYVREISGGFRIIILTILIAGAAAVIHPVEEKEEEGNE